MMVGAPAFARDPLPPSRLSLVKALRVPPSTLPMPPLRASDFHLASMTQIAAEIFIILLLLVLNGVFAMSEIAVVASRKVRLEQRADAGDRGARAALDLAHEPTAFLSTVQVGITLIGVLAGAFGGASIAEQLADALRQSAVGEYADGIGLAIVVGGITYASLIVGELAPKRIALGAPERIAAIVARPMRVLATVASPLVRLLTASTNVLLRLAGVNAARDAGVTEDEIRALVEQAEESGAVRPEEREVVEGAFRLGDREAGMLMTPRPDVAWLDVTESADHIRQHLMEQRGEHVLVCREVIDEVIGFVRPEELLAHVLAGGSVDATAIERLARPPVFVPSVMPAYGLLKQLQVEQQQAAVVLDEYGGVVGVVTVDEILEDLVGELTSAAPGEEPDIVRRDDGSWLVDVQVPITDVERLLDVTLVAEERPGFHTLGGYVLSVLGRIPRVSDRFTRAGYRFEVMDMDGRRVDKVMVVPAKEGEEED